MAQSFVNPNRLPSLAGAAGMRPGRFLGISPPMQAHSKAIRVCFLLCGLLAHAWGENPSSGPAANLSVLLITVDTLRADHLKCYGYAAASTPTIDQLAADGFRFERAYAQAPLTLPSHYSILTGTYPFYHGVRDNSRGSKDGPPFVSEILQHNGYRTAAFVGSFILDSRFGLNRGFDFYGDRFDVSQAHGSDLSHIERPAAEVVQMALEWIGASRRKFFAWVHLFDPHDPYSPPEPFRSRFSHSPYDGEIAYTDHALATLFRGLREKGLLSSTHIIVTGDHGEGLGEHGEFTHGLFVYDSTMRVPLIMRLANRPSLGKAVSQPVRNIDIAPTILKLVGLQPGEEMQGRSLTAMLQPGAAATQPKIVSGEPKGYFETFYPQTQFGWSELRGIRTERYKYIEAPRPELYDIASDPQEQKNLFQRQQALAAQMKEALQAEIARYTPRERPKPAGTPEPETLQLLQSLGYVASAAVKAGSLSGVRADPKDKIDVYNKILKALALSNRGNSSAAVQTLEEVLHEAPEVNSARLLLGVQYEKSGNLGMAARQFAQVLVVEPENVLASFNLAQVSAKQEKVDEAIAWNRQVLKIDPGFSPANIALGIIYRKRREWSQAIQEFQKALTFGPNFAAHYNLSGIHALQGELDLALKHAQEAIELKPSQAESYEMLGSIYLLKKQLPEAERTYLHALELNPQSDVVLINLAKVYTSTGRIESARNALQQALKLNPNQETARLLLAQLGTSQQR